MEVWIYTIVSVIVVSAVSLSGILLLSLSKRILDKAVFVMVSFAVGSMIGNVLFDLLPESYEGIGDPITIGWLVVLGFVIFFGIERLHLFNPHNDDIRSAGYMNLIADGIHNFTDGVLVAASWLVSTEAGLSTTIAIVLHEFPQELSDFGVLLKSGFDKRKALIYNFISALTAVVGAVLTLIAGSRMDMVAVYMLPIAAGCFIYLSFFSLLPLIVKDSSKKSASVQMLIIIFGVMMMYLVAE